MGDTQRKFEGNTEFIDLGIEDSMEMTNSELNNFLTNDGDDNVVSAKPAEIKALDSTESDTKVEDNTNNTDKKDKFVNNSDLVDSVRKELFGSEEDDEDDEDPQQESKQPNDKTPSKEEIVDTNEDNDEEVDETSQSNNVFSRLAKDLFSIDFFTLNDDEETEPIISNAEELLERFNGEKVKQANKYINDFLSRYGEDYRKAFDAIYIKGVSPKDYFNVSDRIETFRDLDLEDTENQKLVFTEYFKSVGLSDDKIQKKLKRAIDDDTLQDDAADYHEILVEKESAKLEQLEQKRIEELEQKRKEDETYARSLQSILSDKIKKKEFDGIPLNQKEAEEVYDFMYTKKWKLKNGDLITDFEKELIELKYPENYEYSVKLGLLLKRKLDLSSIKKKAISEKNDELFVNLATQEKTVKRSALGKTGKNSSFI